MQQEGLPQQALLTTEQAYHWLNLSEYLFEQQVEQHNSWLHPVYVGKRGGQRSKKFWDRDDIRVLQHILQRQSQYEGREPEPAAEKSEEES